MNQNTKCHNCGADLQITDRFCSQCGSKHEITPSTIHDNPAQPTEPQTELSRSLAMLDNMEGLDAVKEKIHEIVDFVQKDRIRTEMMGYPSRFPRKYLFIGNPCTGRTTVARLLANILHELGVMPQYKMIAVWSKALVGNQTGHSATRVRNAVDNALGGVLFIDDVHLLLNEEKDPLVQETIDTLMSELTNHTDDLVCIAAGTPLEVEKMLNEHKGLRERFDCELVFER